MALTILPLKKLIDAGKTKEEIDKLLFSFQSISLVEREKQHDVEYFLHHKAIEFEKFDISRTYLVLSTYKGDPVLVGYYALSYKPLVISKKNYNKLSGTLRKLLSGYGNKTSSDNFECRAYLLGQVGKNFSEEAKLCNAISGEELVHLATRSMLQAHEAVGGRIFYLECEDNEKLRNFYTRLGFKEIEGFKSLNGMCLFVRRIK